MTNSEKQSNHIILHGLRPEEYEHPLDRQALSSVESTPGIETLIRKMNEYDLERFMKIQYTGSNIKVTPSMFPDIYEVFQSICKTLYLPAIPELYIDEREEINAGAIGSEHPIIVLTKKSVKDFTVAELTFIIGHEIGHIKSQHMLYHVLANEVFPWLGAIIGEATFGLGKVLVVPIQLALGEWYRKSELTADRAGLLACQDVNSAITAFMKMAGAPESHYDQLNPALFLQQAKDFNGLDINKLNKVVKFIAVQDLEHPWTVIRCAELQKWIESGDYEKLLQTHSQMTAIKSAFCKHCGKEIKPDSKFCIFCGNTLGGA